MALPELAAEFGVSVGTAQAWQQGLEEPPTRILRTLDLLGNFGQPVVPAQPRITARQQARSGTFTDNMKLPVHRWFRYSAGFSAQWVERIVEDRQRDGRCELLLDPFAGSGTALLAAQSRGVRSIGLEPHHFVQEIARTKLNWNVDATAVHERGQDIIATARRIDLATSPTVPSSLLEKCFHPQVLARLLAIRQALETDDSGDGLRPLLKLALTAILRECSHVGTAQWQYVLPNKSKARSADPFAAFEARLAMFASDIAELNRQYPTARAEIWAADARSCPVTDDLAGQVDLIVTSPPYPNNYDYADATRLEMTFWGEIAGWGDLQRAVRHKLVRSCSQHSAAERLDLETLLADPVVEPIRSELAEVCRSLAEIRLVKGGRKTYHTMVAAYFCDLARVWQTMRKFAASGSDVCFVIGDSAPYGVYVPADLWLTKLAEAAGFGNARFEKLRDRNTKWKNRKHRVPLKEGNLWLRG